MNTRITLLALALIAQLPVHAATFCVDDSATLASALATASGNNQADDIRIKSGSYSAPLGGFRYEAAISDANNSLQLSGGWSGAGCVARTLVAGASVLTGNDQRDVLHVLNLYDSAHTISIDHLTIAHGANFSSEPGAAPASLEFYQASTQAVGRIEHCVFRDNTSSSTAAGPFVKSAGTLTFRNNLIAANGTLNGSPAGSIVVTGAGQGYVQNNTVCGNSMIGVGFTSGWKIGLYDTAVVDLSNNIVWGNTGGQSVSGNTVDLYPSIVGASAVLTMHHNDVGHVPAAWLPPGHVGTISVDPQFVGAADRRLAAGSPLIDAGTGSVGAAGGLGSSDLDGAARVNGAAVDLGAFENQLHLFADGFD